MKKLLTFLAVLAPLCLMAQAPPVLRQALTTNTAPVNPTNPGQIPVWTGNSWIFTTNLPGIIATGLVSGDLLWTNDNGIYRPTAYPTNLFLDPTAASGASVEAIMMDTQNPISDQGARLLSLYNNTTNRFSVTHHGGIEIGPSTHLTQPAVDGVVFSARSRTATADFPDISMDLTSTGDTSDWFGHWTPLVGTNYALMELRARTNSLQNVLTLQAGNGGMFMIMQKAGSERLALSPDRGFLPYLLDTEGSVDPGFQFFAVRSNGVDLFHINTAGDAYLPQTLTTTVGITNNGTYQHSVGAFTGALFVSSNANGVAYWTTNVNNIGVTNLSVYNNVIFNGSIVSNFNRDLNWTNDGVVLKGSEIGLNPRFALRWGSIPSGSPLWDSTNVGFWSVAMGSNVLARGFGSVAQGIDNEVRTNAVHGTISGGRLNTIGTNSFNSTIGGGFNNTINGLGTSNSVISGGIQNLVQNVNAGIGNMVIGGGNDNQATTNYAGIFSGQSHRVNGSHSGVLSGGGQAIDVTVQYGTAVGGQQNTLNSSYGFIGGGKFNGIGSSSALASTFGVVGGGAENTIGPIASGSSSNCVIGGGYSNLIGENSDNAVIVGGNNQEIRAGTNAVIGGGSENQIIGTSGRARNSIIPGGENNKILGYTDFSFILGSSNSITTNWVGIIGWKATNTTIPKAIDIAPDGDVTKTTFHSASNYFRAPVVIGAGGALITNVLTASAALTFTAVSAQTSQDQSITVTGTTTNDVVTLGIPFQVQGAGAINTCFSAFTSNDTVWVRFNNYSSATRSTNGVFKVLVTRF